MQNYLHNDHYIYVQTGTYMPWAWAAVKKTITQLAKRVLITQLVELTADVFEIILKTDKKDPSFFFSQTKKKSGAAFLANLGDGNYLKKKETKLKLRTLNILATNSSNSSNSSSSSSALNTALRVIV